MKPVAERTQPTRQRKPGEAPLHRIPVYDHKGNQIAHVGHTTTEAGISRFTHHRGAKLVTKDGRKAWVGDAPPKPPKPKFNPAAAQPGAGQGGPNNSDPKATHSLEISLKAAKGSVTDKPSAPKTTARPARS